MIVFVFMPLPAVYVLFSVLWLEPFANRDDADEYVMFLAGDMFLPCIAGDERPGVTFVWPGDTLRTR